MDFLESDEFVDLISDLIHEDTQCNDKRIDLTVSEIYRLTGSGSLDFGGSEFTTVATEAIEPEKQDPSDDYGWWDLKIDTYKAILNESIKIPEGHIAFVQPHIHAERAGLGCNSQFLLPGDPSEELEIHFHVPVAGCRIKQNARIASMFMIKI